jgi:hypothetical protein
LKLIKLGIKLGIAAIVVNATWHVYLAYSAHYKFRDSVEHAAQIRGNQTDDELRDAMVDLAAENDIPIAPEEIVVKREGISTLVKAEYKRDIDLLPGRPYPWSFSFQVSTYPMQPGQLLQK